MKKSLLALILAVTMVAPVFAAEGDISINGKLGLGISNNLNVVPEELPDDISFGVNMEMPISIGAEIFYGLMNGLSVGAGINYGFSSDSKSDAMGDGKVKAQTTNFYLAVRPEFKVESDIFSCIYLIGQIGGSSISFEADGEKETADVGVYFGIGAGTIIKDCFIVELILSSSNGSFTMGSDTGDLQYTATTLNVGYKFAL